VGITVRVRYLAVLRALTEEPERDALIRGNSLASLMDALFKAEGEPLKGRLFSNGRIRPDVIVFVNDIESSILGGMKAELKDGDTITFLPSVHGG